MSRLARSNDEDPPVGRRAGPPRVLFICSRNRRRSPTAEAMFNGRPGLEVASAGLASDAEEVVTPEALAWADLVIVMEKRHRGKLQSQFAEHLRGVRIVCLDIPDKFAFMDLALIKRLETAVTPILHRQSGYRDA